MGMKKRRRRVIEMDVMWMSTEEAEEAYVQEDVQIRGPRMCRVSPSPSP